MKNLLILLLSVAWIAHASKIESFRGAYSNQHISFVFKAAHGKEWGGFKLVDKSQTPAHFTSYSFRNHRFEYKNSAYGLLESGIGGIYLRKNTITFETSIKRGAYRAGKIAGTIKKMASRLIIEQSSYDLEGNIHSTVTLVYYRK
jgi:hypothetical protein